MEPNFYYNTAIEAIERLKTEGYTVDFNLANNALIGLESQYNIDDFQIKEVYRYGGDTDPSDEAVVYAIASTNGVKGIFVSAYGFAADETASLMLKELNDGSNRRYNNQG